MLRPEIHGAIMDFYQSGKEVIVDHVPTGSTVINEDDDQVGMTDCQRCCPFFPFYFLLNCIKLSSSFVRLSIPVFLSLLSPVPISICWVFFLPLLFLCYFFYPVLLKNMAKNSGRGALGSLSRRTPSFFSFFLFPDVFF